MKGETIRKEISNLIRSGKTEEAFDYLRRQSLDQETTTKLAVIEADYRSLLQEELKGTIGSEEKQLRRNRINDRLLVLFDTEDPSQPKQPKKAIFLKFILPAGLVLLALLYWWITRTPAYECLTFPEDFRNKIMVLPFENVGARTAKPEVVLCDKINALTQENNLSTIAKVGPFTHISTVDEAVALSDDCEVNLLVWGTYSSRPDSIRLVLNYSFNEQPDWNNLGELVALKDVTSLQSGRMLKSLEDAILSLCGLIALREGDGELAKKWFDKVAQKEEMDRRMLNVLNKQ